MGQVPANDLGLNPSNLKWQQIETPKAQIIFPKGIEEQGQRVANLVDQLWDTELNTVGNQQKKVTILLHNQTTIPNGFVTVGPFRSEFYMTPPQFDLATNWLDFLTIHEYRHIQQFANTQKGITKAVKSVLGSWAWGGMFATALPRWYLEGDAVDLETRLTATGRGRQPAFTMAYRSILESDRQYNYEKASAGSLKDYVPNWYRMGYHMIRYGRTQFEGDIWAQAVEDAVQYKGLFFPFSRSLKKQTGLNTKAMYEAMTADLRNIWEKKKAEEQSLFQTDSKTWNKTQEATVIDYNNPKYVNNQSIIAEKSGYNQLPTYVLIDQNGREKVLTQPGIMLDRPYAPLSYKDGKLCWAELAFHPRWQNKNYSIIRVYDVQKKTKTKLTSQSRLFAPDLSPDGKRVVAVSADVSLQNKLVVIDLESGTVIQELPNPGNAFLSFPKWIDDQRIVLVKKGNETHQLEMWNLGDGTKEILTPPTAHQISHPFPHDGLVYYGGAYHNANNIYVVDIITKAIFQVTNAPLGAFQPTVSPDGSTLAFASFTVNGHNIETLPLDSTHWQPIDLANYEKQYYTDHLNRNTSILADLPNEQFPVRKFHKWSGLFNPHSILPSLDPPLIGARVLSDNKFSTLSADLGGFYNINDDEWWLDAGITYAEFFPVFRLNFRRANRSANFLNHQQPLDTTLIRTIYTEDWTENDFGGGVTIPINFSQGNFSNRLSLSLDYHYLDIATENRFNLPEIQRDTTNAANGFLPFVDDLIKDPLRSTNLHALDWRFRTTIFQRLARQHVNPRWGLVADIRYRHLLDDQSFNSDVWLLRGDVYFPGLFKNHSFYVNTMYQKTQFLDNYRFPNFFFYPRGYNSFDSDEVTKVGFNYAFPLWYPDVALGPLAFVKRVKGNIFFDYGVLDTAFPYDESESLNSDLTSMGIELRFDVRALRLVEIDFGFRYSYLFNETLAPDGQQHQFDFLLLGITAN